MKTTLIALIFSTTLLCAQSPTPIPVQQVATETSAASTSATLATITLPAGTTTNKVKEIFIVVHPDGTSVTTVVYKTN